MKNNDVKLYSKKRGAIHLERNISLGDLQKICDTLELTLSEITGFEPSVEISIFKNDMYIDIAYHTHHGDFIGTMEYGYDEFHPCKTKLKLDLIETSVVDCISQLEWMRLIEAFDVELEARL